MEIADQINISVYPYYYSSFLSSSTGGRALRSFSGKSFSVVYVATPIGLL